MCPLGAATIQVLLIFFSRALLRFEKLLLFSDLHYMFLSEELFRELSFVMRILVKRTEYCMHFLQEVYDLQLRIAEKYLKVSVIF